MTWFLDADDNADC